MLKEKAGQYYFVQDKSCAEAILLAANEAYHLGMTEEATKLFAGFRTGMGMGGGFRGGQKPDGEPPEGET